MTKDTGGSAFPFRSKDLGGNHIASFPSMTLRDWFAGQALSGLCIGWKAGLSAEMAYEFADAMIAERNKL